MHRGWLRYGVGLVLLAAALHAGVSAVRAQDAKERAAQIEQLYQQGKYADALGLQRTLADDIEKQETAAIGRPGPKTANELGKLGWYTLLVREFDEALRASTRAIAIMPDAVWIEINRAHALVFLGRVNEARSIYLAHRGELVSGRNWERVVIEDFEDLRKAGLYNAAFREISAALSVEIVPRIPHSMTIMGIAVSPDGRLVLTGSWDKTVKVWSTATGQLIRTLDTQGLVLSVVVSPDGTQAIVACSLGTQVWDLQTGEIKRNTEYLHGGVLSPSGDRLYGIAGKSIVGWNLQTGHEQRNFEGANEEVTAIAISRDGAALLSGNSAGSLKLWETDSGRLLRSITGHSGSVAAVAISPDGREIVSAGADNLLKFWNAQTGLLLRSAEEPIVSRATVQYSADGKHILTVSRTLKLWDAATGRLVHVLGQAPSIDAGPAVFTADGAHVVAIRPQVSDVAPDGNRIVTSVLELWDASAGTVARTSPIGSIGGNTSLAAAADGSLLASGSWDRTIKLWDARSGRLAGVLRGHTARVETISLSRDAKRMLSGGADGAMLWDVAAHKVVHAFEGRSPAALSPDGTRALTTIPDRELKLWDAVSGQMLHVLGGQMAAVSAIAFSSDGAQVAVSYFDKTIKLWNAEIGQLVRTWTSTDTVKSMAFSPDGATLLSGCGTSRVDLWEVKSGQLVRTFTDPREGDGVNSVAFSPDGKRVLAGNDDSKLRLWDTASGKLLRTFQTGYNWVLAAAFSPDGAHLISTGTDATIRIWDSARSKPQATLIANREGAWVSMSDAGFFAASFQGGSDLLGIVRGLEPTSIQQVHQSLFNPDLLRAAIAGDPDGEVRQAAEVVGLDKVIDSGSAPAVEIMSPVSGSASDKDLVTLTARVTDRGKGIGRIEWRVNGVTAGIVNPPAGIVVYEATRTVALDPGENVIEAVAYNGRNLLASLPARTSISFSGPANADKPILHVLAIGIDSYVDKGGSRPGSDAVEYFAPLRLAVADAKAIARELQKAGTGLYSDVKVRTVLDAEATPAGLERVIVEIAAEIQPRDTFILFAAAHGYSQGGRFYLIPQDYQGGLDPSALTTRAIGQERLQDWIANRIKAKKAIILLDTCESGALVGGYAHARTDASASESAIGRLHEATGRPVLTAAAAGQEALEVTRLGHGVFTSAVIDALYNADRNGDGLIEVSELAAHVQELVPKLAAGGESLSAFVPRGAGGSAQTARFGSRGDDFALARRLQ